MECVGAYLAVVLDEKLAELEGLQEKNHTTRGTGHMENKQSETSLETTPNKKTIMMINDVVAHLAHDSSRFTGSYNV